MKKISQIILAAAKSLRFTIINLFNRGMRMESISSAGRRWLLVLICATQMAPWLATSAFAQDAEYQLIRRSYTVNGDGTYDMRFRKEIKLLRNRAITAYADKGETFILFNPDIDQLTINESYTIRPDGSRVTTPANAFIDQLPSECQDCGRYNHIRERAVIHTALEYNCIIVLDYTIHRKSPILDEQIILSEDCPIKKYEVIYNVDANAGNKNVGFETQNLPKGHKFLKNEKNKWHLVLTNIPQNFNDPYLPSPTELYPSVRIHFGSDIQNVDNEPLPEADYVIGELYDKKPATFAANIRNYVDKYIKTNNIPPSLLAYHVSTPRQTLLDACGTPADKQRLLAAMLRQAELNEPAESSQPSANSVRAINIDQSLPWQGKTIGDGFGQMELPKEDGSISIDPAKLSSDRTAPLKVTNCNEKYHYVIALPRTPKRRLVGEPVNISYSKPGIGSIRISISQQQPGAGIEVVRELVIDVENGIVTPKQYKDFRKMMQDWNAYKTITIKTGN